MVLVCITVLFDNESSTTWEKHLFEIDCEYGRYIKSKDNYLIPDGDKGFIKTREKFLTKSNYFTCCIHKEGNITKNGA